MLALRLGGAAMAVGGLLFIVRIGPVVSRMPDGMAFPPETTADLVRLAASAGGAWPFAHAAGLAAVALLIFGYWAHAGALARAGRPLVGRAAAIIASIAFALFAAALYVDGFIVYEAARASAAAPGDEALTAAAAAAHDRAIFFFTPAVFLMFIAMGVLASRMIHGQVHSRWLGWTGQAIAILALTAYLTGLAGPHWDNLQIGGSAMMAGYAWQIIVGLVALFGRGVRD